MLSFEKYQGTGNDFLVVDRRHGGAAVTAEQARRLCDRHRGVGGDGVLVVAPDTQAAARMQVLNADGSESDMCGNGLRCVAKYLHDHDPTLGDTLAISAGQGRYSVRRVSSDQYAVEMGAPTVKMSSLPRQAEQKQPFRITSDAMTFDAVALAFGNPHLVIFVEREARAHAERYGGALERHFWFPERVNVSFVEHRAQEFLVGVYERGSGLTQACGSAACAVAVAAVWTRGAPREKSLAMHLPGGVLRVTVGKDDHVHMQGEAVRVYRGEVDLS